MLELQWVSVNQWRVGGSSWFAPLHQAAWHGASDSVVTGLLERGALRSLRTRDGRTAYDVAAARGHSHLLDLLSPVRTSLTAERAAALGRGLASVIDGRLRLPEGIADSYGCPCRNPFGIHRSRSSPSAPTSGCGSRCRGCTGGSRSP